MEQKILELNKNTFGIVADIKGAVSDIIILLNNPTKISAMANKEIDPDVEAGIIGSFKKGFLKFDVDKDAVFCISLQNGLYIYDQEVNVIIPPGSNGNGYIEDVILAFQGLDGVQNAISFVKDFYNLDVVDLFGTVSQYDGFEMMKESYYKTKAKK